MLLADALGADSTMTIGLVLTLGGLAISVASGILTSRVLQGRSIRDIEKWRDEVAEPQLKTLMDEHKYQARRKQELHHDSSSQSTTRGQTQPFVKAGR